MSERKDKTPEQVTDEDYKVAPTSADKKIVEEATGENYSLPELDE